MQAEREWIDYNGHLNMAFYHVLFDRAVDEAFGLCGLGPGYIRERNASFFTVDSRIRYRREITLGVPVRIKVQLVDFDDKRLHYWMGMHHAGDGWLAASCENLSIHVDITTRQASAFPDDIRSQLAMMRETHALLPRPEGLGEGIRLKSALQS